VPGSPAEREKLVAGDEVLKGGDKLCKGRSLRDIVRDVRGKVGEAVTLTVLRDDKVFNVTIKREVVPLDVVSGGMLDGGVGYVRIHYFQEKTPVVLKEVLRSVASSKAMVVDVRQNGGGLFDEVTKVASLFLKPGTPIVRIDQRGKPPEVRTATGEQLIFEMPLVVLVNEETASGAELLAAALAEGRGAQIVGTRTFGKWSVQKLDRLANGYAMKYTTSTFATPSGRSFGGLGLPPDVEVAFGAGTGEHALDKLLAQPDLSKRAAQDPQLRTALGLVRPRP
jgi:carboxyl-terminal processing protease